MKIYEISYTLAEEIELSDKIELPEGVDASDIRKFIECTIHLGGNDIASILEEAMDNIEVIHGDMEDEDYIPEYEITGIKELPNVDVMNWPGEFEPCQCPQCRADRMADEDVMHFNCPECGEPLKTPKDQWEYINCRKCNESILKDNIVELGKGKYQVINTNKKEE